MAEIVGLVASAVTLAATAEGAAQLSSVVFKVVSTFRNAPQEMAAIANGLLQFSESLHTLAEIIDQYQTLYKPAALESIKITMRGYKELEVDLKKLIDTDTHEKLKKLRWCMQKPKAKNLLKRIESIKQGLTLQLAILQLAKNEATRASGTVAVSSQTTTVANRWRSVVECAVQANRQTVLDAQHEDIEDAVQYNSHREGRRTQLDIWKEGSFDSAIWLYHLVFSPSVQDPSLQATVSDGSPDRQGGVVSRRSVLKDIPKDKPEMLTRDMIVWNARTEPKYVVDRLLFTWTTLSHEQITSTSIHQHFNSGWSDRALEMLEEVKPELDRESISGSEDEHEPWYSEPPILARTRTRRAIAPDIQTPSSSRPHVRFDTTTEMSSGSAAPISQSARSTVSHASMPTVYTIDSDDSLRTKCGNSGWDASKWSSGWEPDGHDAEDTFNDNLWESVEKGDNDFGFGLGAFKKSVEAPPAKDDVWGFCTRESGKKKKKKKKGSAALFEDSAPERPPEPVPEATGINDDTRTASSGNKKKKKKKKIETVYLPPPPASPHPELSPIDFEPVPDVSAVLPAAGFSKLQKGKSEKKTKEEADERNGSDLDQNKKRQPYVESDSEPQPEPIDSTATENAEPADHPRADRRPDWYQRDFVDTTRYSHPIYRPQERNRSRPVHHPSLSWNPFAYSNIPASYQHMSRAPPPPTAPLPPPPVPHAESSNDPRLSKIETLLASHQERLAQMNDSKVSESLETAVKHLLSTPTEYNETIRELVRSLGQQKETQLKVETDFAAERRLTLAAAEEKLEIIHGLERLVTQQKDDQRKAEERWLVEKEALQHQAFKAAEIQEVALKDIASAQSAQEAMRQTLEASRMQTEAEKKSRIETETKAAEARRKADEENKERFQHYEQILKASRENPRKEEFGMPQPVRQTFIRDHNRSVEVNEYSVEALGSSMPSTLPIINSFQDDFRRSGADTKYEDRTWPRRERHNSFVGSARSVHSSRISLEGSSNQSAVQQSQQTIVFSTGASVNTARISQLQKSLAKSGIRTVLDGTQGSSHDEMVLYKPNDVQIVRSTIFWEAPALALGSELLLTLKESGWKPSYSRRSAGGRTYFFGEQPVHSYFFQDHYSPQFIAQASCTQHDAVVIDKGLIEEYALMELGFEYHLAPTGEWELDGRLTFSDLETLVERSFLMKENNFRRQYRRLQWQPPQPTTPFTATTFERDYASSTISTTSRSSRRSDISTILDRTDDDRCNTSQTSHLDSHDGNSEYDADRDTVISPSAGTRLGKSTNPFLRQIQDGKVKANNNPWGRTSIWGGCSLI